MLSFKYGWRCATENKVFNRVLREKTRKDGLIVSDLKKKITEEIKKALKHLRYSYEKVKKIKLNQKEWSEAELGVLESFSSRFARSTDLLVSKYFRLIATEKDPAYRGSVIDLLNASEKWGLIESSKTWQRIRQLGNVAAHDYSAEDLSALFHELFELTPKALAIETKL